GWPSRRARRHPLRYMGTSTRAMKATKATARPAPAAADQNTFPSKWPAATARHTPTIPIVALQSDSSMAWPRWSSVITLYQQNAWASSSGGTTAYDAATIQGTWATAPTWCRTSATWTAKQTSATVAALRPTNMLDRGESTRQ